MDIKKEDPNTETKLPKQPSIFQRGNHDYPYLGDGNMAGGHWGEYHVVTHPDSASADLSTAAREQLDINDGYTVTEKTKQGKSITHHLNPGHHYNYVSGGHSNNKDGHSDIASGGNENRNVGVDRGSGTAGDGFEGHGGAVTKGTGGSGNFENHTGGTKYVTTTGDLITQHDGNIHTNNKGDTVAAHLGNKYSMVQGECGLNIQGGNYDVQVNGGKTRIKSGSDILIQSDSKITLQVDGSSITLDSSTIKLLASAIKMAQG